jgi:superfamily I DNA/RNA helicase
MIGDGQQAIYPGGYSLAEAGISVAGRGVVLSTNYRNTRETAAFAAAIVEGDEFVDLEGGPGRADAALDVPRTGPSPSLQSFESLAAHDAALVSWVRSLVASGVDPGDIGVLTATNRDALAMIAALRAAGFDAIELESYRGVSAPSIKVGTIKRAKGLEFKQVLLARVDGSLLPPADSGLDEGALERREIERRELYGGITRACNGLWVGRAQKQRNQGGNRRLLSHATTPAGLESLPPRSLAQGCCGLYGGDCQLRSSRGLDD